MARWMCVMVALVSLGCSGRNASVTPAPEEAPVEPASAAPSEPSPETISPEEWAGTEEARRVYDRLVVRDGPPPCDEVEAGIDAPAEALTWLVEQVQMPPWVPLHAARCLARGHGEAAEATLVGWVRDPELQGLGRVILAELDAMPAEVAVDVARAGLDGALADAARERAEASSHAEVRALVVEE